VTHKTKTRVYHAIVKSTITHAAETGCLKAKTVSKLNSTEMEFWRRSARISMKDKIRNSVIKQKMNVTTEMVWTCSENGRGETAKKSYEMEPTRKKKMRKT